MGDTPSPATKADPIGRALTTDERDWVYHRWPELRTTCPTCNNTGTYRWKGAEHECDCSYQKQLAKHYTLAGIGLTFQRLDWEDFVGSDEVLREIAHYLDHWRAYVDRGIGIIFTGDLGTGKSMLAHLLLKELVKKGARCYATLFSTTIEEFTKTWGDNAYKQWFADTFIYSRVLLLDELGREQRSNNNLPQSTFDHILRTRVHNSRPTFLTTNIDFDNLDVGGYGSGVLSLLRGSSRVITMQGADFRPISSGRTDSEVLSGEVRPIV